MFARFKLRSLLALASVLGLLLVGVGVGSAGAADAPLAGFALGTFNGNASGNSVFVQSGNTVRLIGVYSDLVPGQAYFSVIYGNGQCDPAQAFPVGPFTANGRGNASANLTATLPANVTVSGTMSISIRRGDVRKGVNTDQDGDGKTGPTDVVAVPGKPGVGLVDCDYAPLVK